jgi:hypothetical protein
MSYRILSLDGGGTWALIQVKALIRLYSATTSGQTVLRDFDLVAANSGGSIVLGGLVEDIQLQDLTGMGPKYSAETKLVALQNVFPKRGTVSLADAVAGLARPLHLLITAFDYDRNRATFFRSAAASGRM